MKKILVTIKLILILLPINSFSEEMWRCINWRTTIDQEARVDIARRGPEISEYLFNDDNTEMKVFYKDTPRNVSFEESEQFPYPCTSYKYDLAGIPINFRKCFHGIRDHTFMFDYNNSNIAHMTEIAGLPDLITVVMHKCMLKE